MKLRLFTLVFVSVSFLSHAQEIDLSLGRVNRADLEMKGYARDTSAGAVIINELGTSYFSEREGEFLVFEWYVKIKILRRSGLDEANFSIPLYRGENSREKLLSVEGITYNLDNGVEKQSRLLQRNVFTEEVNKHWSEAKFALPAVREGSVIEVRYKINSPFMFNLHAWKFQSEVPKIHSEYWVSIPGNFVYNIALRGYLQLSKNESTIVEECYTWNGLKANCVLNKYAMNDVPAFRQEEDMTARTNFLAAINFELSEVHYPDGRLDKITKEWKDVDEEMRNDDRFGGQIKKARSVLEDQVKVIVAGKTDEWEKAKAIYDWVKKYYDWDEVYGQFTEFGAKKAFETRKGNVADINLSLVGALQVAGLEANPIMLSTRSNGLPVELFPVLSEFNYVIGSVDIGGKRYLLDATHSLQPFGFLPLRCLNGKGRLMTKVSAWTELKPRDKKKTVTSMDLVLTKEGTLEGKVSISYQGYAAFSKRVEILRSSERSQYVKELQGRLKEIELSNYEVEGLEDIEKPLLEKFSIKLSSDAGGNVQTIFFNPFLMGKVESNPYKSPDRLYPVDFGAPKEEILTIKLDNQSGFQVDEMPASAAMTLPRSGGRFLFNTSSLLQQINVTSSLSINKAVYTAEDYPFIREMFGRMVQINQSQIVLRKK